MGAKKLSARIVLDVWGGECSMDHVARFLPRLDEYAAIADRELRDGFLINLRLTTNWGSAVPFDARSAIQPTSGALQ